MDTAVVDLERTPSTPRYIHRGIDFGCDYNPEQWDSALWREDVTLMRQAGISLVAVNVFGWSDLQGPDGSFDFSRLDEIVELLHANGIRVNLGTGTASPPPWLTTRHPEILPVADDGTRRFPGGRQAWCPSSRIFREAALELTRAVAERYGRHPALALWHVSNELGCHNAHCFCDRSAEAFREWLRGRYGSIDELNRAWGTSFWSQRYTDWAEIGTPRRTLSTRNPAQVLDFSRFSSDELRAHLVAEREVIRQHSDVAVTTNFMVTAHIRELDYWQWAPEVDVIANDHYLDHRLVDPSAELAFAADLTRGLAGGRPWMLMEHATGSVNWQPHNLAKLPGQMLRDSLAHVARGADSVCFFQWRASLQGSEKFHSALVPHAGTDSRLWREVRELGDALSRLTEVAGSRVLGDVALLFSWEAWWAFDAENRPSDAIAYLDQVWAAHRALREAGATVDVVAPGTALGPYRLVVVPGLHLVREDHARLVEEAVRSGTHALVTFYSGIVDDRDRVWPGGYPGAWRELLGVRVEEFAPVLPGERVRLASGAAASLWTERVVAVDCEVRDRFEGGPADGAPALTRRRGASGAGDAWYLATFPDAPALAHIVDEVLGGAGVVRLDGVRPGVDVIRRVGGDHTYRFIINHTASDAMLPARGRELLTGVVASGDLHVPAGAVRVIREVAAP